MNRDCQWRSESGSLTKHKTISEFPAESESCIMRKFFWNAMTLAVIAAATACIGLAQTSPASAQQPASLEASNPPSAAPADTTKHSTAVTTPAESPLEQEVEILKARIDQLEKEVEHTATLQGSNDATALSTAEKNLLGPNDASALRAATPHGKAAAPAAEPAPPEISAETTHQGSAVPGRLDLAEQQWAPDRQPHGHQVLHAGVSR